MERKVKLHNSRIILQLSRKINKRCRDNLENGAWGNAEEEFDGRLDSIGRWSCYEYELSKRGRGIFIILFWSSKGKFRTIGI